MNAVTDKIEDAWGYVKERMSNPFFFSFAVAWLVINWEITIAFLFYDADMLAAEGCISYKDYVISEGKTQAELIWHPAVYALAYTFLVPVYKWVVKLFQSGVFAIGNWLNLRILSKGKIGVDKYIELQNEVEKQEKILADRIEKASDNFNELTKVKNENATLKQSVEDQRKSVTELENQLIKQESRLNADSESLIELKKKQELTYKSLETEEVLHTIQGKWFVTFSKHGAKTEESININSDGSVGLYNRSKNEYDELAVITFAMINAEVKEIVFAKEVMQPFDEVADKNLSIMDLRLDYLFNRLKYSGSMGIEMMVGYENGDTAIRYERSTNQPKIRPNDLIAESLKH